MTINTVYLHKLYVETAFSPWELQNYVYSPLFNIRFKLIQYLINFICHLDIGMLF